MSIPLQHIINASLRTNKYPKSFKEIKTSPLHKKGRRDEISNYRIINSLDSSAVVFESILNRKLLGFCESNDLLPKHQYGFRKGKSTTGCLSEVCKYLIKNRDDEKFSSILSIDLEKAYDALPIPVFSGKNSSIRCTNRYNKVSRKLS